MERAEAFPTFDRHAETVSHRLDTKVSELLYVNR